MHRTVSDRLQRLTSGPERWMALFVMVRVLAVALATTILALHQVTAYDMELGWLVVGYGALTVAIAVGAPGTFRSPVVWACDIAVGLALVWASGDWRSPFYLLALTALAPPAVHLPFRRAFATGLAFTVLYFCVALLTGLEVWAVRSTIILETLATHLAQPLIMTLGLAYATEMVRRFEREQHRAQRLAIETERRRIAWELHDSAKQRLHAAHLVLSTLPRSEQLDLGLEQLQGAAGDMETSIAELRSPLEGRPLHVALRERADELRRLGETVPVRFEGVAPPLPTVTASHAFRILAEAMTNAVRHSRASEVRVSLGADPTGGLRASVTDDGRGLPSAIRPGANGLRSMRSRAFAINGRLTIGSTDSPGTRVALEVPNADHDPAREQEGATA